MNGTSAARGRLFRIGTRGSALALAQAQIVLDRFRQAFPDVSAELTIVRTAGDIDKVSPLTEIGGRGVFTNALEAALLAGEIDAAVHSAKDLPSTLHPDAPIVAVPDRDDPRDVLVSRHGTTLDLLPTRPVIGTSSRRREALVRQLRPDALTISIRGNIDSRLRKAEDPGLDGVVLAAAGIRRMGWAERISEHFPLDRFVPSPGQGAIAVQALRGSEAAGLIAVLDDAAISRPVVIERAFLAAIGAGCTHPVGAHVLATADGYRLLAAVGNGDGSSVAFADEPLQDADAEAQAAAIAGHLAAQTGIRLFLPPPPVAWGAAGTLLGARVVVTRPRRQAGPLLEALAAQGAEPIALPTIRIEPIAARGALDAALRELRAGIFPWIAFTSVNAVEAVSRRLEALDLRIAELSGVSVAAIGEATARAAAEAGWRVTLRPESPTAEAMAVALGEHLAGRTGVRMLYPRSAIGRDSLPETLRHTGVEIVAVDAYTTVTECEVEIAALDRLRRGEVDVITFSSPSSVRGLLDLVGAEAIDIARIGCVCAGPVTAQAARAEGFRVAAVSSDPGVEGMVAAVATAWRSALAHEAEAEAVGLQPVRRSAN